MARILLLQSRESTESILRERRAYADALKHQAELVYASALNKDEDFASPERVLSTVDGVVLGGSGDFDIDGGRADDDAGKVRAREILVRLKALISYAIEKEVPVFGVCFGHQLIAEMYGGAVTHDHSQKKVGTYEVTLTKEGKEDPLFSSLPATFSVQYIHKDSVTALPQGATLLASGPSCRFSALRYGDTLYTTQFHPERDADGMCECLEPGDGYLPDGVDPHTIVRASKEASSILKKWATLFITS